MSRSKLYWVLGLVALVAIVVALVVVVGNNPFVSTTAGTSDQAAATSGEEEEAPPPGMALDPNFKPVPAAGQAVALAWPNLKVNNDNTSEAHNEPFIAVNPANPRHMVVGANSWQVGNGNYEVFAYYTFDGGKTWQSSQPYINRNASRVDAADPTVAFGSDGSVYFAFVAKYPADGAVAVSRSLDGGRTWSSQSWVTGFTNSADKPAIAAGGGKLYLYYQNSTLYGTVSADNGSTWTSAAAIEAGGRNAYPVVDASGNINVFYNTGNSIKLARISTAASGNAYVTTTIAQAVALQPRAAHYRAGIYPTGGVDGKGRLYVAWADGRNAGRGNDILYSRSIDAGKTWSAPVTLNTDAGSADQLMPGLAVSRDGAVTVAWLDNRNDPANVNYDIYMARATDGAHFAANERVTTISSNPNNDPRTQGAMIGDYITVAVAGGTVYPVWTDTRNNHEDIFIAPVPVISVGNSNQ